MKHDDDPAPIGAPHTLAIFSDAAAAPEPDPEIRALSLWQPHATAIALGLKPFETRSWPTAYRGPLVIHAALKKFRHQDYPIEYYNRASKELKDAGCPLYALRYGEAICLVDLVDCVPADSLISIRAAHRFWGDFAPGRFAFRLEHVRKIWPPIRATGRQGFFSISIPRTNEAMKV